MESIKPQAEGEALKPLSLDQQMRRIGLRAALKAYRAGEEFKAEHPGDVFGRETYGRFYDEAAAEGKLIAEKIIGDLASPETREGAEQAIKELVDEKIRDTINFWANPKTPNEVETLEDFGSRE